MLLWMILAVSSLELTLLKESYAPQETLQAEITGNFISLTNENIFLYRNDTPRPMPIISDLTKQNNIYYFYTVLPNQEGNFSIKIENAQYTVSGEQKSDVIIKDFQIIKSNDSILQIDKGFIIASDDFSIKVKSNTNQDITAQIESSEEMKALSLREEVEETLEFSLLNINDDTTLKIGDYNIPIFVIKKNKTIVSEKTSLTFSHNKLSAKVTPGNDYPFHIIVRNAEDFNITHIKFSSDLNTDFKPKEVELLEPSQEIILNITIAVPGSVKNNLSGQISAKFHDQTINIPVMFEITKKPEEVDLTGTSITEQLSCDDQKGKICLENEDCTKTVSSLEGNCCIGECVEVKTGNYRVLIGIIIFVVIFGVMYYVYTKFKRPTMKSSREMLKEKSNKFDERMEKPSDSKEVSRGLDRV